MQALSFAVHIPLVAFGISFPVMVLFAESRWLRTGDTLYRTLARRWTRIMVALFAVGVITGTILSFEMGLLWPNFTATFGGVFGLGFAIEGFSFFLKAIAVLTGANNSTRIRAITRVNGEALATRKGLQARQKHRVAARQAGSLAAVAAVAARGGVT
jgi:cytochrome bd-type quinol oxidase subunit 1